MILDNNNYVIIYVHKGDSFYLDDSFKITRQNNPNTKIILLGDMNNIKYCDKYNIEFYNINNYMSYEFNYKHYSINNLEYEKFCFERWLILYNFISMNNYDSIIYNDSDNVFFMDVNNIIDDNIKTCDYLYLGYNDNESIFPNIFIAQSHVFKIINDNIIGFYNKSNDDIIQLLKDKKYYIDDKLHFSDMNILAFILFQCNLKNINIVENNYYKHIFIDCNYNYTKSCIVIKNGELFYNDKKIFNLHFQGCVKNEIANFINYTN